jgi:hypothetical protein
MGLHDRAVLEQVEWRARLTAGCAGEGHDRSSLKGRQMQPEGRRVETPAACTARHATQQRRRDVSYVECGARRRGQGKGKLCRRPAGWGTDHPGAGRCKLHGGGFLRGL